MLLSINSPAVYILSVYFPCYCRAELRTCGYGDVERVHSGVKLSSGRNSEENIAQLPQLGRQPETLTTYKISRT